MAIIQTIRDKYAKLAGGVIVLALAGFILMDATSGSGGGFFKQSTDIAKVNGQKIEEAEFNAAVAAYEAQIKTQNPEAQIDENTQAQISDQVFTTLVNQKLLESINKKLGITVTEAEMKDLISGENPDAQLKQAFTNPQTGVFNPEEAAAQIAQIERDPKVAPQWKLFKEDIYKRRYQDKFNALITGAIYTPKFALDAQDKDRNTTASIGYVQLPYTLIGDNEVKVSDEDIRKYMERNKKIFTVDEETRSIEYVSFDIVPFAEDSARVFNSLNDLVQGFSETKDDDAFVSRHSENPRPIIHYSEASLGNFSNAAELLQQPVGKVYGPFFEADEYVLAKIIEKTTLPDSVTLRHVLVATKQGGRDVRTEEEAKARIDSVAALAASGVPFDTLALTYSDDGGSNRTGGKYTFKHEQKGTLTKEFGEFAFSGNPGQTNIVKVESDNYSGYHFILIEEKAAAIPVTKIAFISKRLNPSRNTNDLVYSSATQFASNSHVGGEAFDKAVKEKNLNKMPADGLQKNSYAIPGIGASKELVKWAYDKKRKVGDVSDIVTVGDRFLVAKLTGIKSPGLIGITPELRPQLESMVKREKKAELLLSKTKSLKSIEAVANAYNQAIETADSVNFTGTIPAIGNEPKVLGYTFSSSFKENTLSPGIVGNAGVFYIVLKGKSTGKSAERNLDMEQMMNNYQLKSSAAQVVLQSVNKAAMIKDNRYERF